MDTNVHPVHLSLSQMGRTVASLRASPCCDLVTEMTSKGCSKLYGQDSVGGDSSLVRHHLSTAGSGLLCLPFPPLSSLLSVCPSVCPSEAPADCLQFSAAQTVGVWTWWDLQGWLCSLLTSRSLSCSVRRTGHSPLEGAVGALVWVKGTAENSPSLE